RPWPRSTTCGARRRNSTRRARRRRTACSAAAATTPRHNRHRDMVAVMGPEIGKSALVVVDMQNDFLHPEGDVAHRVRENPNSTVDLPFLMAAIPQVARLADAFR